MTCDVDVIAYPPWGNPVLLSDNHRFILTRYSGLGTPESRRLTSNLPAEDGYLDRGQRSEGRRIVLSWALVGAGKRPVWDMNGLIGQLTTIFRPEANLPIPVAFILKTGGRPLRSDLNMIGSIDPDSQNQVGSHAQEMSLVFESGDSRFYDPAQRSLTFALSDGSSGWAIPWAIPWAIGQSVLDTTATILYANGSGTAAVEYPVIRVTGPITAPVVENVATGEVLPFTDEGGLILVSGEFVDIDLRRGRKTAIKNDGTNADQFLSEDNDLGTFHLARKNERLPNGSFSDGQNTFRVSGFGVTTESSVQISWLDRFISIFKEI